MALPGDENYCLTLTVTDNYGRRDTTELFIRGSSLANPGDGPLADAGPDQYVMSGGQVFLDGGASRDPDGSLIYQWEGPGLVVNDIPRPEVRVGSTNANTEYEYVLRVTDSDGNQHEDTTKVLIHVSSDPVDSDGNGLTDSWEALHFGEVGKYGAGDDPDNDSIFNSVEEQYGLNPNVAEASDEDGDGVPAPVDNCPSVPNPGQGDIDGDEMGNLCDPEEREFVVTFSETGQIRESAPDSGVGGSPYSGNYIVVGDDTINRYSRGVFSFDLSDIVPGSIIEDIGFHLREIPNPNYSLDRDHPLSLDLKYGHFGPTQALEAEDYEAVHDLSLNFDREGSKFQIHNDNNALGIISYVRFLGITNFQLRLRQTNTVPSSENNNLLNFNNYYSNPNEVLYNKAHLYIRYYAPDTAM